MPTELLFEDYNGGLWEYNESTGLANNLQSLSNGNSTSMVISGGTVYFTAHASGTGSLAETQLWSTNGTAGGTGLVVTLPDATPNGQTDFASIYGLTALSNGKVAFAYDNGDGSDALYVSDGTAGGTAAVTSYTGNSAGAYWGLGQVAEIGSTLLFEDSSGLWGYNEGTGQASLLQSLSNGNSTSMVISGGTVYFTAHASGTGSLAETQLWSTNGTAGGTRLVATLPDATPNGQTDFASISGLTALSNGKVAFAYGNGNGGDALYVSDGTAGGTAAVTSYTGNSAGAYWGPGQVAEIGSTLLFEDSSGLWGYNEGTGQATLLQSLSNGNSTSMVISGGTVYFTAHASGTGSLAETQLWSTNGTAGSTGLVVTLPDATPNGQTDFASISGLTALSNGKVAFAYGNGNGGDALYVSDGTAGGTAAVTSYTGNSASAYWGLGQVAEQNVACFAAGTRLLTEAGEIAVEDLRMGTRMPTLGGRLAPVTWIGRRGVDCRRHARPVDVQPILVRQGAFGQDMPHRDLRLSPDHAVYVDGVLIPVRYLVNGATILRQDVERIVYFHVELPAHGIVLAEGLACESYLDTGNRAAFANEGTPDDGEDPAPVMAHADFARAMWRRQGCEELVLSGDRLTAAKARLLARAEQLGHATTWEAEPVLLVGGKSIFPWRRGQTYRFALPTGANTARLLSRQAIAAEVFAYSNDHRRLGLAVAALCLDGRPFIPGGYGWHLPERGWQWTDGDAVIACAGASVLELDTLPLMRYRLPLDERLSVKTG